MAGKILIAALVALAGAPAAAEEWYYVTDNDDVIDYVDATSIARSGDTATFNAFLAYHYGAEDDGQTWYSRIAVEMNCTDHRFRTLSEESLDENGEHLRNPDFNRDWLASNDRMDFHAGFVCDGMYRDGPVDDPAVDADLTWYSKDVEAEHAGDGGGSASQ